MAGALTFAQAWRVSEAVGLWTGARRATKIDGQRRTALDIAARRASNELGVRHLAAMPAPQPTAPGRASVDAARAGQAPFPPLFPSAAGAGGERHP